MRFLLVSGREKQLTLTEQELQALKCEVVLMDKKVCNFEVGKRLYEDSKRMNFMMDSTHGIKCKNGCGCLYEIRRIA